MMTAFFSALGKKEIPVDATKIYSVYDTFNESTYYLNISADQNPQNKNIILQVIGNWTNAGHLFTENNFIAYRVSNDRGLTWGTKGIAYNPDGNDGIIDVGGGYYSNGTWGGFTDVHLGDGSANQIDGSARLIYISTPDNGTTWSSVDVTSIFPADGLTDFRAYGNMIENSGVLMFPMYRFTSLGNFTNSARYVLRSDNFGTTWTAILVEYGTTFLNECTMQVLDNSHILIISRNEDTKEWNQYISADNGLTWANQGNISFGESFTFASPGRLLKFKINKTPVIAFYYPNRGATPKLLKVVYAKASDLVANGISGWNLSTKTIISSDSVYSHYGDVYHYDDNFNARAVYVKETATNTNSIISFTMPSTHYNTVKTALGI